MKRLLILFTFNLLLFACYAQTNTQDPLVKLREGNKRFYTNKTVHPRQNLKTVKALAAGQHPFAIIVSCSDSRVGPEIVFDQGLGDIFSIRTAGNVMSDYEEGSIEYAAEHLHTNLIVVLGHQGCGAVKAFLDYAEQKDGKEKPEIPGHIKSIVEKLASEKEEHAVLESEGNHYESAVLANIKNGVTQLRSSDPILSKLYNEGEVKIVGAVYNIDNGKVEFLDF